MSVEIILRVTDGVLYTPVAAELALSKGGWEGWLQCQLWYEINTQGMTGEREVPYPGGSGQRCDLVVDAPLPVTWVEIKAFGIFREGDETAFLDSIRADVLKLDGRPGGTSGLMLVAVPLAVGAKVLAYIRQYWPGFQEKKYPTMSLFYLEM